MIFKKVKLQKSVKKYKNYVKKGSSIEYYYVVRNYIYN